jgi:hypothetical protein
LTLFIFITNAYFKLNVHVGVFPLLYFQQSDENYPSYYHGISHFNINTINSTNKINSYINITYTLTGYIGGSSVDDKLTTIFDEKLMNNIDYYHIKHWKKTISNVNHIWFHQWEDFEIPNKYHDDVRNYYIYFFIYLINLSNSKYIKFIH